MHVSGITYTIDASMPSAVKKDENGMLVVTPGKYRVKDVTVGGEPLDPDRLYTVCSSDYILKNAGDGNKIRYTRMLSSSEQNGGTLLISLSYFLPERNASNADF